MQPHGNQNVKVTVSDQSNNTVAIKSQNIHTSAMYEGEVGIPNEQTAIGTWTIRAETDNGNFNVRAFKVATDSSADIHNESSLIAKSAKLHIAGSSKRLKPKYQYKVKAFLKATDGSFLMKVSKAINFNFTFTLQNGRKLEKNIAAELSYGFAEAFVQVPDNTTNLKVSGQFEQQIETVEVSTDNAHLHIDAKPFTAGKICSIRIKSNVLTKNFGKTHLLIVGDNGQVTHKSQDCPYESCTFSMRAEDWMVPIANVIAFVINDQAESIIYDHARLPVGKNVDVQFNVKVSNHSAQAGENVTVSFSANSNSFIALSAASKQEFSEDRLYEDLTNFRSRSLQRNDCRSTYGELLKLNAFMITESSVEDSAIECTDIEDELASFRNKQQQTSDDSWFFKSFNTENQREMQFTQLTPNKSGKFIISGFSIHPTTGISFAKPQTVTVVSLNMNRLRMDNVTPRTSKLRTFTSEKSTQMPLTSTSTTTEITSTTELLTTTEISTSTSTTTSKPSTTTTTSTTEPSTTTTTTTEIPKIIALSATDDSPIKQIVEFNLTYHHETNTKMGKKVKVHFVAQNCSSTNTSKSYEIELKLLNFDNQFEFSYQDDDGKWRKTTDDLRTIVIVYNETVNGTFIIRPLKAGTMDFTMIGKHQKYEINKTSEVIAEPQTITRHKTETILVTISEKKPAFSLYNEYPNETVTSLVASNLFGKVLDDLKIEKILPDSDGDEALTKFSMNVFKMNYLQAIKVQISKSDKDNMLQAYEMIRRTQQSDGSFNLWTSKGKLWVTAFVVKTFVQLKKLLTISENNSLLKALKYLQKQQASDNSFGDLSLTAFVAEAFLVNKHERFENSTAKALNFMAQNLSTAKVSNYELAIAVHALKLGNRNVDRFIKDLELRSIEIDKKKFWRSSSEEAEIETAAYAMMTFIKQGKQTELLSIVRWLQSKVESLSSIQCMIVWHKAFAL